MGVFMAKKSVYPDFSDVSCGIPELGRDCVTEGMEGDFSREAKAGLELSEGSTEYGPTVFLFRPIKTRYKERAFTVVLQGHYIGFNEFGV